MGADELESLIKSAVASSVRAETERLLGNIPKQVSEHEFRLKPLEAAHVKETDSRLTSHERECALRYGSIQSRLAKIEAALYGTVAFLLVGGASLFYQVTVNLK